MIQDDDQRLFRDIVKKNIQGKFLSAFLSSTESAIPLLSGSILSRRGWPTSPPPCLLFRHIRISRILGPRLWLPSPVAMRIFACEGFVLSISRIP